MRVAKCVGGDTIYCRFVFKINFLIDDLTVTQADAQPKLRIYRISKGCAQMSSPSVSPESPSRRVVKGGEDSELEAETPLGGRFANRKPTEQEALEPAVTTRFLETMDIAGDAGERFKKMIECKPWHPVVRCVLTRQPYNRKEVISLSRCFLHWCTGCGKGKGDGVTLTRCGGCEVAYFCSEKCARRALKKHHTEMCPRLRELHDALMPSLQKAYDHRHEIQLERRKAQVRPL